MRKDDLYRPLAIDSFQLLDLPINISLNGQSVPSQKPSSSPLKSAKVDDHSRRDRDHPGGNSTPVRPELGDYPTLATAATHLNFPIVRPASRDMPKPFSALGTDRHSGQRGHLLR